MNDNKRTYYLLLLLTVALAAASCNNTKYLPKGDALYTGAEVTIKDDAVSKKKKKALRSQLTGLARPRPNKKFLGMRIKLSAYNMAGNPKKKNSPRGWLKNKVGEPPVLLSQVNLTFNAEVLKSYLENKGFFHARVEADTTVRNKKASAQYTVTTGDQYTIAEVRFPEDTSSILVQRIRETIPHTLLRAGHPFDLDLIKTERIRIDDYLKEHGFYYFSPDNLLVRADSTIGNKKVLLQLIVKPGTPDSAKQVFRINDVFIYTAYNLRQTEAADTSKQNAEYYKGYYVVDRRKFYKPRLFEQAMPFDPGDVYNRTDHNAAINRLINLDIFKFVRNRFEVVPHADSALLNAYYYLTRQPKKSLRIEIRGNTKSNNLTGSNITVGWRNRNTFRGGEILSINAFVGFEVQYSGVWRGFNTTRYGAEANLSFPRFLVPFYNFNVKGGFLPRTRIMLGYEVLNRQKLYSMNSFNFNFTYNWKESIRKEHELTPFSITYVNPINVTDEYLHSAQGNASLLRAVEKQFILGSAYMYTYNNLLGSRPLNGIFLNTILDLSGNIAGLITGANITKGDTVKFFGTPFSQYIKTDVDFRYYRKVGNNSTLANRIIAGVGIPHGNSRELPYVKQFFSGGNNSVRAFRSRSLGPGTFRDTSTAGFYDQSGDIRLELNTEFRFPIAGFLFGALFVDAGNIWLFNESPGKPGAKFSSDFLKELAVGAGAGLRFDFNFLVLRLDLAFPLRKPWLTDKERWVIREIDFGNKDWRSENLVWNLAIGYPF